MALVYAAKADRDASRFHSFFYSPHILSVIGGQQMPFTEVIFNNNRINNIIAWDVIVVAQKEGRQVAVKATEVVVLIAVTG